MCHVKSGLDRHDIAGQETKKVKHKVKHHTVERAPASFPCSINEGPFTVLQVFGRRFADLSYSILEQQCCITTLGFSVGWKTHRLAGIKSSSMSLPDHSLSQLHPLFNKETKGWRSSGLATNGQKGKGPRKRSTPGLGPTDLQDPGWTNHPRGYSQSQPIQSKHEFCNAQKSKTKCDQ